MSIDFLGSIHSEAVVIDLVVHGSHVLHKVFIIAIAIGLITLCILTKILLPLVTSPLDVLVQFLIEVGLVFEGLDKAVSYFQVGVILDHEATDGIDGSSCLVAVM